MTKKELKEMIVSVQEELQAAKEETITKDTLKDLIKEMMKEGKVTALGDGPKPEVKADKTEDKVEIKPSVPPVARSADTVLSKDDIREAFKEMQVKESDSIEEVSKDGMSLVKDPKSGIKGYGF